MSALVRFPASGDMQGVALVVHGLNLKPLRMMSIVDELVHLGFDTVHLTLYGHGDMGDASATDRGAGRLQALRRVSYTLWRQEFHAAYQVVLQISRRQNVPVILAGFSLGALLATIEQCESEIPTFDRMLLFSPAVAVRRWCRVLRPLARFPGLVIPSLAPASYRANRGTTMAAYGALYTALDHLACLEHRNANIPTIVFADPGDELVDFGGLVQMLEDAPLTNWQIYRVAKSPPALGQYRHLTIDPESVGAATWAAMSATIREFLCGGK